MCVGRWGGLGVGIHHSHGFAPAPARSPVAAEKVLYCRQAPLNQLQLLLVCRGGGKNTGFSSNDPVAGSLGEALGPGEPGRPPHLVLGLAVEVLFTPLESVGATIKFKNHVPQTALCFDAMTGLVINTLWTVYILFLMEIQLNRESNFGLNQDIKSGN